MSGLSLLGLPVTLWLSLLLAVVIFTDLRMMRIPNALIGVIATLWVAGVAVALPYPELLWRGAAGLAVFSLCLVAFAARLLGGGDTKLLPIVVLFVAASNWALFALFLSGGLIVGLVAVRLLRLLPETTLASWQGLARKDRYPLGPGIGLGGIGYCLFAPQVAQLF